MSDVEAGTPSGGFPTPPTNPVVALLNAVQEIDNALARMIAAPHADTLTMLGATTAAAVSSIARAVAPVLGAVSELQLTVATMRGELIAVQRELGIEPSGRFVDVAGRLANIEARLDGEA